MAIFRWNRVWFSYFLRTREDYKSTVTHSRGGCWQGHPPPSEPGRACRWEETTRKHATTKFGLFICWIGHNYPVPQWARWPNQNGVIRTISIGDKFFQSVIWRFCNVFLVVWDPRLIILFRWMLRCFIGVGYWHIWLQQDTCYYRQHSYGQTWKIIKFLTNGLT